MKHIKFRAFKDENMYYDVLVSSTGWMTKDEKIGAPHFENTPAMQFTGLKDKNGKEIYEGDIIRHHTSIGPVISEFGYFQIIKENNKIVILGIDSKGSDCEVIGNIYENTNILAK